MEVLSHLQFGLQQVHAGYEVSDPGLVQAKRHRLLSQGGVERHHCRTQNHKRRLLFNLARTKQQIAIMRSSDKQLKFVWFNSRFPSRRPAELLTYAVWSGLLLSSSSAGSSQPYRSPNTYDASGKLEIGRAHV